MGAGYLALQIFNGLVSGAYFALLSLGLAIIFGMMRIVNFAHGAMYMLGAFGAYLAAKYLGLPFWWALVLAPVAVGLLGALFERTLIRRLMPLDPLYNLLLTFGLALVIEDFMKLFFGTQGTPYAMPAGLSGVIDLGITVYPIYRLAVIAISTLVCLAVWFAIEKTPLGAKIRAATENPQLTEAFGIDVSRLTTFVFAFGVGLAGLAGVLAAPTTNVTPVMGSDIIITTFAVVVIGGMGSIKGSIFTGFIVGIIAALGAVLYPPIANTLIFLLMAAVLIVRPTGLFGAPEGQR
ncbi:MAG: branched-chain amino acid ABC transporter permease [Candidatus Eremiobacteraeota bacterium]|nr:branched-chain amino acid ABC transporter permease [Candidatus Eremiobacteraeota bacterium]MBV8367151.1 branched-chain amino acid ABC transporter permease [Candidatus Eremiobacteraeota bacterium]